MTQPTSKFYVQSGTFKWTLLSTTIEQAAIRFIQLALQPAMKGSQPVTADLTFIDEEIFSETAQRLGPKVLVSESGFDGTKVGMFETSEVVAVYRQQIRTLESLIRNTA